MKKSLIFNKLVAIMLASSTLFLGSCVKNRNDGAVDFSQLAPIMQILEGGMKNFSQSALLFPSTDVVDTAYFHVNYAATTTAPSDISVTLSYDPAALAAYNAANPTSTYEAPPDSIWNKTLFPKTVVVKAGQNYSDAIKLAVYPNKIDAAHSYMWPITITNASGVNISGNFGTIYYHVIGNPLAGNYQDYGQRFNYTGSVPWGGPPAGLTLATAPGVPCVNPPAPFTCAAPSTTYNMITTFSPVTDHTITGTMGNVPDPATGALAQYFVTGSSNFSTATYDFASTFNAGYSNIDKFMRGYRAPSPTQKAGFRLITHYNNTTGGAGNDRIVDESFTQQ